jgi:hypothetical protein
MIDFLTGKQREVAERICREEGANRRHLVMALSGSHAYGFPSPDSDLDLKAVHIEPTQRLLGFEAPPATSNRLEIVDGVEVDYTSNELGPVLAGVLDGNGNYIERILGALIAVTSPEHEQLRPLVQGALSRRVYRHYRGFAGNQRKQFHSAEHPTAKTLLYILRTTLTGAHLLETGELRADLTTIAGQYGFDEVTELVEEKRRGENTELSKPVLRDWTRRLDSAFALLDKAHASSPLPQAPANVPELEAWLLRARGVPPDPAG